MSDNTNLNLGFGGDTIRTVAKTANAPAKTQILIIDVGGGADGSVETPLVAGQQTTALSLSVTPASDISSVEPAGAPITGASMPAGGLGLTGWLSAIWSKLGGTLATTAQSYNGASYDPLYNNWNSTLADGGTKTSTFNGATQTNFDARGVMVVINVSAATGSGETLTAQIQAGDGAGNFVSLPGATLAITATGAYFVAAYPGATSQSGVASLPLPRIWRVAWMISGLTPSFTFTAVAAYVK